MNTALKIALGISLLGICGLLAFYIAIFAWLRNTFRGDFADLERQASANEVELPFLGPDPWRPAEKLEGRAGRYVMEKYGFRIDLPNPPKTDRFRYSREDARSLVATFGYVSSNPEDDYMLYGLQVKDPEERTVEAAAGWFEMMYGEDGAYTNVRLRRRDTQWGGLPAIRISGSFLYFGDQWFVDGMVTIHEDLHIATVVQDDERAAGRKRMDEIAQSTLFKDPKAPWPKAKEARGSGSRP
ncbi:MAG TPA: hypothetical protein PLX06_00670 [Fimbriimonadaceae bacterium]|nr:hypothetical protein [Fimbriimonadaceae bacterium]